MSNAVVTYSKENSKGQKIGGKRGAEDEGKENVEGILNLLPAESLPISRTVSTAPSTTDQFMFTPEFRSHFIEFVPGDTLMTLRLVTNGWKAAADVFINVGVKSGEIIVHSGNDLDWRIYSGDIRALVTRVIFSLHATKVGEYTCKFADNLVVVDIPKGITSIGLRAFTCCMSLTAVYLPITLTSIGNYAFNLCTSLENVDLLHTNLQELGEMAVAGCLEIKSMTIPDSLQTLGYRVFDGCMKLVPSNINTQYNDAVVAHLRSLKK